MRNGDTPGLADLGMIVVYLPRGLSPAETGLVEELARQGRCTVVLGPPATKPPTGRPASYRDDSGRPLESLNRVSPAMLLRYLRCREPQSCISPPTPTRKSAG